MRHILVLLFCVIFTDLSFGQGDAPALLQGQHQSTKSVGSFIQAPNKQITKISGATALMETGNKNLLENPSFEHPTVGFGWTDASTNTKSAETTVVIDGKKSLKIELSANDVNLTQTSTLYASQFGGTTQGVASIRIKTDVLVVICTVEAGIVSATNCLNSSLDNQWHVYKIPFVLGATSNGINIFVDSGTGTVYLDDAFVGAMEVTAVTDASRIAGEAVFPPTSSCIWFRNNAVIGAFASTNACPGPTIVKEYVGDWQTTDANLPQITINSLPAGVYKATFYVPLYSSAAAQNSLAINDGTTTCDAVNVHSNTDSGQGVVSCTFHYGVAGDRTFSLYGASSTSLINIENNTSGSATRGTKFQLEYYTSFSTYSSANADTDWVSCNHTTASFIGFGTVSAIETQCKRQGSDLLMKGKFTAGTPTATEARVSLPVWGGVQLISSNSSLIPSLQIAGDAASDYFSTLFFRVQALIEPSVSYFVFGRQVSTVGSLTKAQGNAIVSSSQKVSFHVRIPIEGWQNSNIIIGQFNGLESCASTLDCTDTFSAKVSAAAVISGENVDWLSGCTNSSAVYTCSFNSGIFTQNPNCSVMLAQTSTGQVSKYTTSSSSQLVYRTSDGSSALSQAVEIICQKQGADYIGKTAKAVANDQSLMTPGLTNAVLCSAQVSSTGVLSQQYGGCFSSCTNATTPVCTFTTNYWAQQPNCWSKTTTTGLDALVTVTGTTSMSGGVSNTAGGSISSDRAYFCTGAKK